MKAVLISIQPKWCNLIAKGKKTVEVRKTKPKLEIPFKCYIYCTSVKSLPLEEYVALHASTGGLCEKWSGKVIGEFVCDRIDTMIGLLSNTHTPSDKEEVEKATCLTVQEITEYLKPKNGGFGMGYGWHISELKIYDEPKKLGAIRKIPKSCITPPTALCSDECDDCFWATMTRPPQSWCYVED